MKKPDAQPLTRLSTLEVHVYVAPSAALVTVEHDGHVSAAPTAPPILKKPESQALTRLSEAVVQVYVASGAAFSTGVHRLQTIPYEFVSESQTGCVVEPAEI